MAISVESLKEMLAYHDNLYYNLDAPELSDIEYDALKKQYTERTGESEYTSVPGAPSESLERIEHTYPIKSLSKVNNLDDLRKEMKRLAPFVVEMKMDGLTVVKYQTESGVLYATRGNGSVGEDITHTAKHIEGLADAVQMTEPIRIEAFMRKSVFEELNKQREAEGKPVFKNPRNAAAGMLRNKDANKVSGVEYVAYNLVGSSLPESEQIKSLTEHDYEVVAHFVHPDTKSMVYEDSDIEQAIAQIEELDRDSLDYEIDGLVIKSNKESALDVFGSTGHHPKNMAAYKFPSQGVWTKLLDVVNQVGRTGKVTPVAIIEPTELMGSTISRVTLHNYGIMDVLKVSKGCDVLLVKANDVIPAIVETSHYNPLKAIKKPTHCPDCSDSLITTNDQQFCQNPTCGSKLLFNLTHLAKRDALDIEGLSEETAKKLISADYISHPFDIFDITEEQIESLEGFAKKSANKLHTNIQKARTASFKQFIYAAGIPTIGRSISEDIANTFSNYEELINDIANGAEKFASLSGVGETLVNNIKAHGGQLVMLREKVTPIAKAVQTKSVDKQLTFVITGKFDQPRKYFEDLVKEAGHKVSGSVSKNTDYLLAGEKAGSKRTKAESLNVPIINTEEALLSLINN